MTYNPKVTVELSPVDRFVEAMALVCLVALWGFSILSYGSLPASIPVHFDLQGNIDGWGSRITIFLLPFISTILYAGMTLLNKFPHLYNYPRPIDPANKKKQYQMSTRLIRVLKFFIQLIFIFCVVEVVFGARQQYLPFKGWLIPMLIVFLMVPTVIYLIMANKK